MTILYNFILLIFISYSELIFIFSFILGSTNIICSDERRRTFEDLDSGIIRDVDDVREERECRMRLRVSGTVRVEITVNSLFFSSRDCDEEYFAIVTNRGWKVPSATLCHGTEPGTRLLYDFTSGGTNGEYVIFKLKMEGERNRLSTLDLSFTSK